MAVVGFRQRIEASVRRPQRQMLQGSRRSGTS